MAVGGIASQWVENSSAFFEKKEKKNIIGLSLWYVAIGAEGGGAPTRRQLFIPINYGLDFCGVSETKTSKL